MKIKRIDFPQAEQYLLHQQIIKELDCRYYDWNQFGMSLLVFYKKGIADHSFMIRYMLAGPCHLFIEEVTSDLFISLSTLIHKPLLRADGTPKSLAEARIGTNG